MALSSPSETLPFSTLIHMITVKLSSTNYLLWKHQVIPLLQSQDLLKFVDGSSPPPAATTTLNGTTSPNPEFETWHASDQRLRSLLLSSLTEEAMSVTIGCTTAREIWLALSSTYSHDSKSREAHLRETLFSLTKGSRTVSEYGRLFKGYCDELAAIGRPVEDLDKVHWFLRGLGVSFSQFSASQMAIRPLPSFSDVLISAERFDLFLRSLTQATPEPATSFTATHQGPRSTSFHNQGRGGRGSRGRSLCGGYNHGGRGRGYTNNNKPLPHCQICSTNGHYADKCSQRYIRSSSY